MKTEIKDASPDGLLIIFKDEFYFDTYEDVMKFIKGVKDLENQIHQEARRRVKIAALQKANQGDKK